MEKKYLNTNLKNRAINFISYLLILLFLYSSISKIFDFNKFQYELGKSPLIPFGYASDISYTIILIELFICYLLYKHKLRKIGLLLSFSLMLFFTLYIYYLLHYSYYIPCSCGGILNDLSWEWHIVFNTFFCVLALISYILYDYEN